MATHGESGGGADQTRSVEYELWAGMLARCRPDSPHRANYYDRGIRVCDEWRESFEAFLCWLGRRPWPEYTLERVNNDGNYEPGNVRWATMTDQLNNTRRNRFVTYRGQRMTVVQAWKLGGRVVSERSVRTRLADGWSIEDAVEKPWVDRHGKRRS